MALYSWYSWMFAINVIIYVVSSSYFRQIYQIFFGEIFHGVRNLWKNYCDLNQSNVTPPQVVSESPVIELTDAKQTIFKNLLCVLQSYIKNST